MVTASYAPGSVLVLLASHTNGQNATPTANSTFGNKASGDLYYLQLLNANGETLEHDFKPAKRDSDGVIGLYDTVERKFWPPTSGSFTGVELSSVATATWTGAEGNGDFSDSRNWTCYDGDGNAVVNVIPESTTDITLGADVPDAGWTAFNASYAGTIDLNGHKLAVSCSGAPAFSVTDSSSETRGELRITVPVGETFTKTASFGITGNLSLVKDGPGTFLWSHAAESALAAAIPVLVTNGVFKIDATTGNLFGASGTVTVKAPGQFDINTTQQYGPVRARTFYIEGDGPDGSGAIVNSAANTQWGYQLNKIELTGDATIGGRGFIDIRGSGNGVDCGGYELTVKNTGRLCVEAGTHLTNATDIVVNGGNLLVCNSCVLGAGRIVLENGGAFENYMDSGTKEYNVPFVVRANSGTATTTNTITTSKNCFTMKKPITVESGATLSLPNGGPWYAGITNQTDATVVVSGSQVCLSTDSIFKNDGTLNHTGGELYLGNRDNNTGACMVENNGLIRTSGSKFEFKTQSSMTGSGTLELAGGSPKVLGDLSGFTGTVVVSNGVAITFTGMNCGGTVAMHGGSTLTVNAASTTSVSSLLLAAGSTLNIANYDGTTPIAVTTSATLPESGTVNLMLNGGAFTKGVYAIYSKSGVTAAEGNKFTFTTTDELIGNWSVDDDTLILTVGEIPGNYWTGRGGDGKMSTGANWGSGEVPAAGSDIDLSGITAATTLIADADRTFGAVTMGTGVITFTNAMAATSFTDTAKIAVAADSTVTLDGDLVFANSSTTTQYIVYTVAEGGVFRVTGRIVLTGFTGAAHLGGSVANTCPGTIAAKGLFNDCTKDSSNYPRFVLGRNVSNYQGMWAIGSDGLDGSGGFQIAQASNVSAMIVAEADFVDSANICNLGSLVIDAAGHEVALGTNTLAGAGGIYGGRNTTIVGGRVVANYDVDNLTKSAMNNPFTVNSGATLALVTGADLGTGAVTVQDGGTLEVAESGTVTLNGNLSLADGAALGFNFTASRTAPQIALAAGKSLTASGAVTVKISGEVRPKGGEYVLTTCGGFDAEGVTVSLAEGAPKWVNGVSVNDDGNIVLGVKPMGLKIFVH